jgi:hypothetical protein
MSYSPTEKKRKATDIHLPAMKNKKERTMNERRSRKRKQTSSVIYEVFITTLGGGMEMGCLLLLLESS